MKNLITRVPNYTQIFFSYSTVMSACHFKNANVHADVFSSPKQTILHSYRNEINAVNQLFYLRKPIDTAIYEKFVCYNHKTKYTDWSHTK